MNFRSIAIIALSLAPISFSIAFFQKPVLAGGFCTHGNSLISEDLRSVKATVLLQGDFDGDGKIDYFCKDIRQHPSNSNRLLEWLVLGNGKTPIQGQWSDWCTHKNSRISVMRNPGGRDQLVCSDSYKFWQRFIP
jgi:hypothetical protein